jgi:L-alanine-DL-glutamate epimerase-like enolase superfamily enzyme
MKISLHYYPYTLQLKHQFTISKSSRKTTPIILTQLYYEGLTGYGEASLPPYLSENQESVTKFLNEYKTIILTEPNEYNNFLRGIYKSAKGNLAALASIDIALHDLIGKIENKTVWQLLNMPYKEETNTSYTIGIDSPQIIQQKIKGAENYNILKIKLGTSQDKEIIDLVRKLTDKPIYADANGGWKNRDEAIRKIDYLSGKGVLLVEQPLPQGMEEDVIWLKERAQLPLIADESIKTIEDLHQKGKCFNGVNIKLMKCGGLRPAKEMISFAKEHKMKIMLGCMTETSCGICAATQLISQADYVDLDGNVLITNDLFKMPQFREGKVMQSISPGIGVERI